MRSALQRMGTADRMRRPWRGSRTSDQDADSPTEPGMAEKLALGLATCVWPHERSKLMRTTIRSRCSIRAGRMGCRSCRQPIFVWLACWRGPRESLMTSLASSAQSLRGTVEKAAINAVMAGCRPGIPGCLVHDQSRAASGFSMHGLLCTLWFAGPVVIVNGPITKRIGMNPG